MTKVIKVVTERGKLSLKKAAKVTESLDEATRAGKKVIRVTKRATKATKALAEAQASTDVGRKAPAKRAPRQRKVRLETLVERAVADFALHVPAIGDYGLEHGVQGGLSHTSRGDMLTSRRMSKQHKCWRAMSQIQAYNRETAAITRGFSRGV